MKSFKKKYLFLIPIAVISISSCTGKKDVYEDLYSRHTQYLNGVLNFVETVEYNENKLKIRSDKFTISNSNKDLFSMETIIENEYNSKNLISKTTETTYQLDLDTQSPIGELSIVIEEYTYDEKNNEILKITKTKSRKSTQIPFQNEYIQKKQTVYTYSENSNRLLDQLTTWSTIEDENEEVESILKYVWEYDDKNHNTKFSIFSKNLEDFAIEEETIYTFGNNDEILTKDFKEYSVEDSSKLKSWEKCTNIYDNKSNLLSEQTINFYDVDNSIWFDYYLEQKYEYDEHNNIETIDGFVCEKNQTTLEIERIHGKNNTYIYFDNDQNRPTYQMEISYHKMFGLSSKTIATKYNENKQKVFEETLTYNGNEIKKPKIITDYYEYAK